ncbi:ECF transporter S component [Maledivibacter halophilus]|uniref:Riboflavin transporter n=1 Tax=Maledivibacter halophilus TaxID=36842 RepID=A0A1T5K5P6_9FIRM|nr:ECF transporter S component [Maledivibacter halophilus]SKC58944.1 Riboflavin transporter FmnP [Maledivibacter halophilus]
MFKVKKMTTMAMLIALSVILIYTIRFPIIPSAPFLEYEPADIPIIIGALIYGTVNGLILTVVASFIQALTVSSASGWIGFVMHVLSTGTLVLVSSTIYHRIRSFKGLVIGLILSCFAMTLVMVPTNLFFTVKFLGVPYEAVKSMLIPAIIPFNLLKSIINSVAIGFVYKGIRVVIKEKSHNMTIKHNV